MNRHDDFGLPILRIIGAAIFGVLLDFRPLPDEPVDEYAKRSWRRTVTASGFRWVAVFWVSAVIVWQVFASHGALAPLLVITWLTVMNRLVVSTGHEPSPKEAVEYTRLGFFMLAVALLATLLSAVNRLLPLPVFPTVATWAAAVAAVVALADAWLTARAMRASQVPEAPDMTPYSIIQRIFGITDVALAKYIEYGALEARIEGGVLTAKIPVGPDAQLEKRSDLDARVALKAAEWQVAFADAATDVLVLEPVDDDTRAQREARARSGGLFAEHIGGGLDDREVIDLTEGLGDQPLPRLG